MAAFFFFQSSKHFCNALLCIAENFYFELNFFSSVVAKHFPLISVFSFVKRKRSAGANYGKYGGWGMLAVLFLVTNPRTNSDVWAGALLCCKIHDWFFHISARFLTSSWYSLLTGRACDKNSWFSTPFDSPNLACFFRSCLFWTLHWDDGALVSMS